jgi:outer membrane protein OmpA-like peptidoglycan-associated protein
MHGAPSINWLEVHSENYLQENGIADDRLTSKGFGKSNPLYTNKTREGRAGNRRVEISLDKN